MSVWLVFIIDQRFIQNKFDNYYKEILQRSKSTATEIFLQMNEMFCIFLGLMPYQASLGIIENSKRI